MGNFSEKFIQDWVREASRTVKASYTRRPATRCATDGGPLLAYLATPYTHPEPLVMEARYRAVTKAAGVLFSLGIPVFSPITHSHPVKLSANLTTPWADWALYDEAIITRACSFLLVLQLDGWAESVGVTAEREIAARIEMPELLLPPQLFGLDPRFPFAPAGVF